MPGRKTAYGYRATAPYGEYEKKKRIRLRVGMHVQLGDIIIVAVDANGGAPIHRASVQRHNHAGLVTVHDCIEAHQRERDKREGLADGQGRILEVSQHIAHADTIANQSQVEGSDSESTMEAVLPERRRAPRRKRRVVAALALAALGWFGTERYQGDGEHASDTLGEIAHAALEAPRSSHPDRQTASDDRASNDAPAPAEDPTELAPRDSVERSAARATTRKARPVRHPMHSTRIARPAHSQTTASDD